MNKFHICETHKRQTAHHKNADIKFMTEYKKQQTHISFFFIIILILSINRESCLGRQRRREKYAYNFKTYTERHFTMCDIKLFMQCVIICIYIVLQKAFIAYSCSQLVCYGWRSGVGITKINDRNTFKWCAEQKRLLNGNLCEF